MKIQGIFAASSPKTLTYHLGIEHFFVLYRRCIYIVVSSLLLLFSKDIIGFLAKLKGVDNFFFIPNFHSTMPKTNEIRVSVKYSNIYTAPNSATTVSIEKFNIEKDAKNRAYAFILSSGLLHQFTEYSNQHQGDPFEECRKSLTL